MSSTTLSATFRALGDERMQDQERQMRTALIALLDALDKVENGKVREGLESYDRPSHFALEDKKSGTTLALEIGTKERGAPDRVVTLSLTLNGKRILTASQTRREWNEISSNITILEGTPDDLLTLSAAMACAKASFNPEAAMNQPNNPVHRNKTVHSSLAQALDETYTALKQEQISIKETQARAAFHSILQNLDKRTEGAIGKALENGTDNCCFESSDTGSALLLRLDVFPENSGSPGQIMISLIDKNRDSAILSASAHKDTWCKPRADGNPVVFHAGGSQDLLDLSHFIKKRDFGANIAAQTPLQIPVPA